ncbi:MAG: hypothetical protein HKN07_07225 [Acidimicrobiia bacterium]|nr:hypothetical protein [Acidimicrobiia bacterium]
MKLKTMAAIVLVALLTFGSTANIAMAGTADERHVMADELAKVIPTGSDKADDKLGKVIARLHKAGTAAEAGDLEKALKEDASAVKYLLKALDELDGEGPVSTISSTIDAIVATDSAAARDAIDAARSAGADAKYLAKAIDHADDGDVERASGELDHAVSEYADAISYAAKARAKSGNGSTTTTSTTTTSTPPIDGFKGKYSEYTFWFVNIESGEQTGPLSGSSHPDNALGWTGKANDGLLEVGGSVMSLHVSCSDVFSDGVGSKSDPAADSPWRVLRYSITKFSDGKADKSCDVVVSTPPPVVESPAPSLAVDKTYRVGGGSWLQSSSAVPDSVSNVEEVDFRFQVVNTGNVPLSNVNVSDDLLFTATASNPQCSAPLLNPGESMECVVTGRVLHHGTHVNTATASGTAGLVTVSATDSVHLDVWPDIE